ncbi:uncharacterized protein RBU57_013744 [Macrochelys suwanniensis]
MLTRLLAALLALAPCALSQVQLAASGPGMGQVSEPLTLTCAVSGGSLTADYWDWYRQLPRGGLDWLGEIDWYRSEWRVRYAPSLQGRITLSADSSQNRFYLLLPSVTAADTATYYCARRDTVTGSPDTERAEPLCPAPGLDPPGLSPSLSPPVRGTRCHFPGAAGGVRPWGGEGLRAPHSDLRCLRGIDSEQRLPLVPDPGVSRGRTRIPGRYHPVRDSVPGPVSPEPPHHLQRHRQEPGLPAAAVPDRCGHRHLPLRPERVTATQTQAGLGQKVSVCGVCVWGCVCVCVCGRARLGGYSRGTEPGRGLLPVKGRIETTGPRGGRVSPSPGVRLDPPAGSQFVGIGRRLLRSPNARDVLRVAEKVLSCDLPSLCLRGPPAELGRALHCQPAVFLASRPPSRRSTTSSPV